MRPYKKGHLALHVYIIAISVAIISRGLYIFYSISKDHFFVFKEFFFSENSIFMYVLIFKRGF